MGDLNRAPKGKQRRAVPGKAGSTISVDQLEASRGQYKRRMRRSFLQSPRRLLGDRMGDWAERRAGLGLGGPPNQPNGRISFETARLWMPMGGRPIGGRTGTRRRAEWNPPIGSHYENGRSAGSLIDWRADHLADPPAGGRAGWRAGGPLRPQGLWRTRRRAGGLPRRRAGGLPRPTGSTGLFGMAMGGSLARRAECPAGGRTVPPIGT